MEPKLDLDWFDASIRAKSAKLYLVSRAHVHQAGGHCFVKCRTHWALGLGRECSSRVEQCH